MQYQALKERHRQERDRQPPILDCEFTTPYSSGQNQHRQGFGRSRTVKAGCRRAQAHHWSVPKLDTRFGLFPVRRSFAQCSAGDLLENLTCMNTHCWCVE